MFLLRTGESLDIKIESFNKSRKPLLSPHRIKKSLKLLSFLCSKRRSEIDIYIYIYIYIYGIHFELRFFDSI